MAIESVIKKNYCFTIVQKWFSNSNEVLSVQDIASIVLSWIIPVWNNIELDSKSSNYSISPILENKTLHTFLSNKDIKKKIKKYTREGLEKFLKHSIVETDANLCVICSNCVHFIDCVEDGFVSFKDSKNLYDNILKIGTSDNEKFVYGTEYFVEEASPTNINNEVVSDQDNLDKDTESVNHEDVIESIADYKNLLLKINDDIKKQCKNTEKFYFWDYKLDQNQFEVLRASLKNVLCPKEPVIRQYAFVLALYVSEWYKRISDTSEGDEWFKEFGLTKGYANTIWKELEEANSFFANLHYKATENSIRHTTSLCVLGGLPINYIKSRNLFDAFITSVYELSKEDIIDEEEAFEDLSAIFRNSAISQSLRNEDGSLHVFTKKLIEYLQEDSEEEAIKKLPFNENDARTDDSIKGFIQQLSSGYKLKVREDFLKTTWRFYLCPNYEESTDRSYNIEAEFCLRIGHKVNGSVVPQFVLDKWTGKSVHPDTFALVLKAINRDRISKSTKRIFVNKGGNSGEYTSFNSPVLSIDINLKYIDYIEFAVNIENHDICIDQYRIDAPIQLYKDKLPMQWSSSFARNVNSMVLFNPSVFVVSEQSREDNELYDLYNEETFLENLALCELKSSLVLNKLNGDNYNTYCISRGRLELRFFHKLCNCIDSSDNKALYVDPDDAIEYNVPIACGYKIQEMFTVWGNSTEGDKLVNTQIKDPDYIVEYKLKSDSRYSLWNNKVPQGLLKIRVSHNESKFVSWEGFVFHFSCSSPIERNLDTNIIKITGDCIEAPVSIEDGSFSLSKIEGVEYCDQVIPYSYDTIPFKVDGLSINVYRALEVKELYLPDGTILTIDAKKDRQIDVPLLMVDYFHYRISDQNGVRRVKLVNDIILDSTLYSLESWQDISFKDETNNIKYYMYANKRGREINSLNFSDSKYGEYDFYYWSIDEHTHPVKVDLKRIEENTYQVPTDLLPQRGKGIIFQSLKQHLPPNYIYPFYPNKISDISKETIKLSVCYKCFDVAYEHKVYFSQFYPLRTLFIPSLTNKSVANQLATFAVTLLSKHTKEKEIYKSLHRFANEFLFDWLMIPVKSWARACRNEEQKEMVKQLFISAPWIADRYERFALEELLTNYFDFIHLKKFNNFRRSNSSVNKFLQTMRGKDCDKTLFNHITHNGSIIFETDIKFLQEIHKNGNIFKNLKSLIFDNILN